MAINNPYIPGDPYSYDLKWLVRKIKEYGISIEQLNEILEKWNTESKFIFKKANIFNVKDFGATGDYSNDFQAISDAYEAAREEGGVVYFPQGHYVTEQPLVFDAANVHVIMDGELYYYGSGTAITIGQSGSTTNSLDFRINVSGRDYPIPGSVGVHLINLGTCLVDIVRAVRFHDGLIIEGDNAGCQSNLILLGGLTRTITGVTLTSSNTGYCNENIFVNGRFTKFSDITEQVTGIKITSADGYYQNNNLFVKPNLEKTDFPIVLDYANLNNFIDVRMEDSGDITVNNDCQNNTIRVGWGAPAKISEVNTLEIPRKRIQINDLTMRSVVLDSFITSSAGHSTQGSIRDMYYLNTTNGNKDPNASQLAYTEDGEYIVLSTGVFLGAMVDVQSNGTNVFHFKPITREASRTRGFVVMYKADGSLITTLPQTFADQVPAMHTQGVITMVRYSYSSGGYSFIVPEDCAYMMVGVETTGAAGLKGFAMDSTAYFAVQRHPECLGAIPTSNGHVRGRMVTCTNAAKAWFWTGSAWVELS